mgnify:CR=1 FL=1
MIKIKVTKLYNECFIFDFILSFEFSSDVNKIEVKHHEIQKIRPY